MEEVILVDFQDRAIGTMEKHEAHEKGLLHRAFSVLVFNDHGELLLQQRALGKYHSPGLWTNTCCSHPRPNEITLAAAHRRLSEEMGMECHLEELFHFTYRAELEDGMIEHEIDHVFFGVSDETPHLNLEEVMAFRWIDLNKLSEEMKHYPERFTAWFHILMNEHLTTIQHAIAHESL